MAASKNKNPLIVCNCCDGKGMVEMSDELVATLRAARKLKNITAVAVAKELGWSGSPTAINNRLSDLVDAGFLSRRKNGWIVEYTILKF